MTRLQSEAEGGHPRNARPQRQAGPGASRSRWRSGLWRLARALARPGFALALIAITVLALTPGRQLPPALIGWHVINHIAAFAVLAFLLKTGWPGLSRLGIALGLLAYGIAIELLQAIPAIGRTTSVLDVVNDMIGVALGLSAAWAFARLCGPGR
jgi:VanZ family protein